MTKTKQQTAPKLSTRFRNIAAGGSLKLTGCFSVAVALLTGLAFADEQKNAIPLSGEWQVQLHDKTPTAPWDDSAPVKQVRLPGSIQTQGLGDEVSVNTKWIGGVADKS
jgi:hypothetical protein